MNYIQRNSSMVCLYNAYVLMCLHIACTSTKPAAKKNNKTIKESIIIARERERENT